MHCNFEAGRLPDYNHDEKYFAVHNNLWLHAAMDDASQPDVDACYMSVRWGG